MDYFGVGQCKIIPNPNTGDNNTVKKLCRTCMNTSSELVNLYAEVNFEKYKGYLDFVFLKFTSIPVIRPLNMLIFLIFRETRSLSLNIALKKRYFPIYLQIYLF